MNTLKIYAALLLSVLLLSGCPYTAKFPIDKGITPLRKDLLGRWRASSTGNKADGDDWYTVAPKDNYTYKITRTSPADKKAAYYEATLSIVGTDTFLNLRNADEANNYFLYKISKPSAGKVVLSEVTNNIAEQFTQPKQLHDFVTKYHQLSFFYNKETSTYLRVP